MKKDRNLPRQKGRRVPPAPTRSRLSKNAQIVHTMLLARIGAEITGEMYDRDIADATGLSMAEANAAMHELSAAGAITARQVKP